ncbi:MBL fold metallo-hydrolase [Methylobacterium sp. Leaf399]|uniref:MBL fold metallo-hydrolase n=1 Tax=Methylobacterium sp. Leaf399 TaxID=1736364 RepID=UPI0006F9AA82|nr:MBL fold metallo-hydrolase [Methylobacterium sp. Leaf399]KQT19121.1 MBL fold metallo-hydrolase [Methylobacterium sp. Leaf399]
MPVAGDASKPLPGVLRWTIGDLTVTALNDGYLQGSLDLVTGIAKEDAGALQAAGFRANDPRITLNAFVVTGAGRAPVMIDTGMGGFGGDTLGRVPAALAVAGVRAEEVESILLTHLHPDHAGGLIDGDGVARYPNAELVLHEAEAGHWLDEAALTRAPEDAKSYFEAAQKATSPYATRLRTMTGGEVAPGITAVPLPGHTPGHTGYRIVSGSAALFMWADIVHLPAIQFMRPEAGMTFDVDGDRARETRRRILDEVASERSLIAGAHLEFPALGYVARDGGGYSFVPELWVAAH